MELQTQFRHPFCHDLKGFPFFWIPLTDSSFPSAPHWQCFDIIFLPRICDDSVVLFAIVKATVLPVQGQHVNLWSIPYFGGFPGGSDGKESAYNGGAPGLIPGSGRSLGEGNCYLLQYSCLEDPMDWGDWRATSKASQRVRHNWATNTFTFSRGSSSSPMWVFHLKEGWALKNWYFQIAGGDSWRVHLNARRTNQSILKEISPEYSLEGLMLKLKL